MQTWPLELSQLILRRVSFAHDGCRRGAGADGEVMSTLESATVPRLIEDGILSGGMIPKMKCAADAVSAGVRKVHIVNGRIKHAMLLELFTDSGVGTEVI